MEVAALIGILKEMAPGLSTEGFINIDFLGVKVKSLSKLGVCIDPTEQNIYNALGKEIELLVTYHPWQGEAKQVIDNQKIGIISLHEAWDNAVDGVSITFAREIGLKDLNSADGIVTGEVDLTLRELMERCQRVLDLNILPFSGELKSLVKKVGIYPGSGFLPNNKKVWEECLGRGCDTILSSELTLLPVRYSKARKIQLVDLGHSAMAKPGITQLVNILRPKLKPHNCQVEFFDDSYSCSYYTNCYRNDEFETVDSLTLFPVSNKLEG